MHYEQWLKSDLQNARIEMHTNTLICFKRIQKILMKTIPTILQLHFVIP